MSGIRRVIRNAYGLWVLKRSRCKYDPNRIPYISFGARIRNNGGRIVFQGRATLGKGVILQCRDGEIVVGDEVTIRRFAKVSTSGGKVSIGRNSTINDFSIIQAGVGGIEIGWGVRIAPFVKVFAENHRYGNVSLPIYEQGMESKGVRIGNNVWIGTDVTILDGVEIGNNAVVGAGSIVVRSLGSNGVYVGSPAKKVKDISRNE